MSDRHTASRPDSVTRRGFLRAAGGLLLGPAVVLGGASALLAQDQEPLPGQGANGSLRDPSAVGRPRSPTDSKDNDEAIKRIEQGLRCTCGCNLDIYTCRTTDFSCTYSPDLHREVVALRDSGKTAQQIVDAFVAKYGEKVLMAPDPKGFNLAGYLVPGVAIAVAGAVLAVVIGRRSANGVKGAGAEGGIAGAGRDVPSAGQSSVQGSPEELERLRRALAEVED
jgi:cytochrome c-type biogenesis protein CcmH